MQNMYVNIASYVKNCFDCPEVGSCKVGIDDTQDYLCNTSNCVDFNETDDLGHCYVFENETNRDFSMYGKNVTYLSFKIEGSKSEQAKFGDFKDAQQPTL